MIGLIVLAVLCSRCKAPRIQETLAEEGRQRLASAGVDVARLEVDGRDAVLKGASSDAAGEELAGLLAAVPGMRSVRLIPPEPVRFELEQSGGAVALRGRLPSDAHRQALVTRAGELWGEGAVTDEMEVDAGVEEPDWLSGLPDALKGGRES